MAKTSETPTGRKRRVHEQLWNDDLFRNRVLMLAEKRGLTVRAAMREAGFTVDYADREMEMRNSNHLMVMAEYFGVSPAYLCGWPAQMSDYNPNRKDDDPPRPQNNDSSYAYEQRRAIPQQKAPRPSYGDERQVAEYREWLWQAHYRDGADCAAGRR